MATNYDIEYPKLQQKYHRLLAEVERLQEVASAAKPIAQQCSSNDLRIDRLRNAIAALEDECHHDYVDFDIRREPQCKLCGHIR